MEGRGIESLSLIKRYWLSCEILSNLELREKWIGREGEGAGNLSLQGRVWDPTLDSIIFPSLMRLHSSHKCNSCAPVAGLQDLAKDPHKERSGSKGIRNLDLSIQSPTRSPLPHASIFPSSCRLRAFQVVRVVVVQYDMRDRLPVQRPRGCSTPVPLGEAMWCPVAKEVVPRHQVQDQSEETPQVSEPQGTER